MCKTQLQFSPPHEGIVNSVLPMQIRDIPEWGTQPDTLVKLFHVVWNRQVNSAQDLEYP